MFIVIFKPGYRNRWTLRSKGWWNAMRRQMVLAVFCDICTMSRVLLFVFMVGFFYFYLSSCCNQHIFPRVFCVCGVCVCVCVCVCGGGGGGEGGGGYLQLVLNNIFRHWYVNILFGFSFPQTEYFYPKYDEELLSSAFHHREQIAQSIFQYIQCILIKLENISHVLVSLFFMLKYLINMLRVVDQM